MYCSLLRRPAGEARTPAHLPLGESPSLASRWVLTWQEEERVSFLLFLPVRTLIPSGGLYPVDLSPPEDPTSKYHSTGLAFQRVHLGVGGTYSEQNRQHLAHHRAWPSPQSKHTMTSSFCWFSSLINKRPSEVRRLGLKAGRGTSLVHSGSAE